MKVTGEIGCRNNISNYVFGNIVEAAVPFIIRDDENGGVVYKPYLADYGIVVGIALYGIDGVEFDSETDLIYEEVHKNKEVHDAVYKFYTQYETDLIRYIDQIVEFRKQEYLNRYDNEVKARLLKAIDKENTLHDLEIKLAKKQNTLLSQQIKQNEKNEEIFNLMAPEDIADLNKRLASGEWDMSKATEVVVDKYINSELRKNNKREAENVKVKKFDARNVLADKEVK